MRGRSDAQPAAGPQRHRARVQHEGAAAGRHRAPRPPPAAQHAGPARGRAGRHRQRRRGTVQFILKGRLETL